MRQKTETDSKTNQKYTNWGEYIYWIYANLNMCNAALYMHKGKYDRQCFMIRSKAFKAYKEGRWQIHSLYENNNLKMDFGKDYCWYCGKPIVECGKLTAEHIFPHVKGGNDSFDNIAYACKKCNSSKGDKDLIKWMYETKKHIPSFWMVCIYMKLVYKFSMEHDLMYLHSDELNHIALPFNYLSLIDIEKFIKEDYLNVSTQLHYPPNSTIAIIK